MAGTFNFCPNSLVPETIVPDEQNLLTYNGWQFASKPRVPFLKQFKVMLYGLKWYLNTDGTFDSTTDPTHNARALELFYQANRSWDNFTWVHPHLGTQQVRFSQKLNIPAGMRNAGGNLGPVEVNFVQYNPGYSS